MPLSDHEQRILAELRGIRDRQDPEFAKRVRSGPSTGTQDRSANRAAVGTVLGVVTLVAFYSKSVIAASSASSSCSPPPSGSAEPAAHQPASSGADSPGRKMASSQNTGRVEQHGRGERCPRLVPVPLPTEHEDWTSTELSAAPLTAACRRRGSARGSSRSCGRPRTGRRHRRRPAGRRAGCAGRIPGRRAMPPTAMVGLDGTGAAMPRATCGGRASGPLRPRRAGSRGCGRRCRHRGLRGGCGGPISRAARGVAAEHRGWRWFPLRPRLARLHRGPDLRRQRRQGARVGEGRGPGGAGLRDYIAMVVSTGMGGGIVLDGRLLGGKLATATPATSAMCSSEPQGGSAAAARRVSGGGGVRDGDGGNHGPYRPRRRRRGRGRGPLVRGRASVANLFDLRSPSWPARWRSGSAHRSSRRPGRVRPALGSTSRRGATVARRIGRPWATRRRRRGRPVPVGTPRVTGPASAPASGRTVRGRAPGPLSQTSPSWRGRCFPAVAVVDRGRRHASPARRGGGAALVCPDAGEAYSRSRIITAYGGDGSRGAPPYDIVAFLRWCQRSRPRLASSGMERVLLLNAT